MENKDIKAIQRHIEDTLIHKQLLNLSCLKMINYLYDVGRDNDALELARRCIVHDNSKLSDVEIASFVKLPQAVDRTRAHGELTDDQKELLEVHWKNNRHHPEFFSDIDHMNEIDIMEMCCDWHARSQQFGTVLIPYVLEKQQERFRFNDEMLTKILGYCEILMGEA
jgi:hypothetical protein